MEETSKTIRKNNLNEFKGWFGKLKEIKNEELNRMRHIVDLCNLGPEELFPSAEFDPGKFNPAQLRIFSMFSRKEEEPVEGMEKNILKTVGELGNEIAEGGKNFRDLRYFVDAVSELREKGLIREGNELGLIRGEVKSAILNLAEMIDNPENLHHLTHMAERFGKELGSTKIINPERIVELGNLRKKIPEYVRGMDTWEDARNIISSIEHLQYQGVLTTKKEMEDIGIGEAILAGLKSKTQKIKNLEDLEELTKMLRVMNVGLTLPVLDIGIKRGEKGAAGFHRASIGDKKFTLHFNFETKKLKELGGNVDGETKEVLEEMIRLGAVPDLSRKNVKFRIRFDHDGCRKKRLDVDWSELIGPLEGRISEVVRELEKEPEHAGIRNRLGSAVSSMNALIGLEAPEEVVNYVGKPIKGSTGQEDILNHVDQFIIRKRIASPKAEKDLFTYLSSSIREELEAGKIKEPEKLEGFLDFLKTRVFGPISASGYTFERITELLGVEDAIRKRFAETSDNIGSTKDLKAFSSQFTKLASAIEEAEKLGVAPKELDPGLEKNLRRKIKKAGTARELKNILEAFDVSGHSSMPRLSGFAQEIEKSIRKSRGKGSGELRDALHVLYVMRKHHVNEPVNRLLKSLEDRIDVGLKASTSKEKDSMKFVDLYLKAQNIGLRRELGPNSPMERELAGPLVKIIRRGDAKGLAENLIKISKYLGDQDVKRIDSLYNLLAFLPLPDRPTNEQINAIIRIGEHLSRASDESFEVWNRVGGILESALKSANEPELRGLLRQLDDLNVFGLRFRKPGSIDLQSVKEKLSETPEGAGKVSLKIKGTEGIVQIPLEEIRAFMEKVMPKMAPGARPEEIARSIEEMGITGFTGNPEIFDGIAELEPLQVGDRVGIREVVGKGLVRMRRIPELITRSPVGDVNHGQILKGISVMESKIKDALERELKL